MTSPTLPTGYNFIPTGNLKGQTVAEFGMKKTPVTNAEWLEGLKGLGGDRFVLLELDPNTRAMQMITKGANVESVLEDPIAVPGRIDFDRGDIVVYRHGDIMFHSSRILLKMVDNPSFKYDERGRIFSGGKQPVVGITSFHGESWNILQTLASGGKFLYRLPTDREYEYVASDGGTKEYGTETGTLYRPDGRKLAHVDEYNDGEGRTVAVDDPRYEQDLPFGVQTTGNVWRWIGINLEHRMTRDRMIDCYGLRGGSFLIHPDYARASFRVGKSPHNDFRRSLRSYDIGMSPVVVRQDSQAS